MTSLEFTTSDIQKVPEAEYYFSGDLPHETPDGYIEKEMYLCF